MKLCLRCNQYFEDSVEQCPTDQILLESVGKDPLIGALINNRYLVDSVIGKGSSGIVYRATRLGRGEMVVAIKVLHSFIGAAGSALDRFLREAQAASRLRNPHIITIWESGVTEDGQPYFVMDYLEGMTLGHLIREKGHIEPKRVLSILRQTCKALIEAHRLGITHRDLKPENIILQESGQGDDYVKLLDFGIADSPQHTMLTYKLEKPRTVSGSPAYMSPEQCQGFELDGRSDIYSLAIVIFEMLTGTRPFRQSEDVNVMVLHVSEPPMTLSEARPDLNFPPAIENVIARALSKQPAQRQATIQDFFLELEKAWEDFGLQPIAGKSVNPASITLNKLQDVATTASSNQKSGVDANTVETEVARVNSYSVNQPGVLGLPPARMSSTYDKIKAQGGLDKLTPDEGSQTHDEQIMTGTSTVQRLMKAAQVGISFIQTQNEIPAINNQPAINPAANPATNPAGTAVPVRGGAANVNKNISHEQSTLEHAPAIANYAPGDPNFHYTKQHHRNTLSRLQGWKKPGQTRLAIVSTRAKAAAIKGESALRPINVWNWLLAVTTLLCLGTCAYIIYAAFNTQLPRTSSIQYLDLAKSGKYDQVKVLLEAKQLTTRLSPGECDQLSLAYLNLANLSLAEHDVDQALLLLARIDPQSSVAAQGRRLREKLLKEARESSQAKQAAKTIVSH